MTPYQKLTAEYLAWCERRKHSRLGVSNKELVLTRFAKWCGVKTLKDVTSANLRKLMEHCQDQGFSAATINGQRKTILAFVAWLAEEEHIENANVRAARVRADPVRPRRALSIDEVQRLFQATAGTGRDRWYKAAFFAGLRRGELTRLRWGDVDPASNVLRVRNTKAAREDVVPLVSHLKRALQQPANTPNYAPVFPNPVSNEQRRRDYRAAGIPRKDGMGRWADLHAMRKTLCSWCVLNGVSPAIAQRLLRHRNIQTTMQFYVDAGYGQEKEREALEMIGGLVG